MTRCAVLFTLFPYTTLFRSVTPDEHCGDGSTHDCVRGQPADRAGEVAALWLPALLPARSEEHTSELQSRLHLVCRLLLEKKNRVPHDDAVGDRLHHPVTSRW